MLPRWSMNAGARTLSSGEAHLDRYAIIVLLTTFPTLRNAPVSGHAPSGRRLHLWPPRPSPHAYERIIWKVQYGRSGRSFKRIDPFSLMIFDL